MYCFWTSFDEPDCVRFTCYSRFYLSFLRVWVFHFGCFFFQPSKSIMRMEDYNPHCCCGNGRMVLLSAGRSAKNVGWLYYKYPLFHDHVGSFNWFDEWTATRTHSVRDRGSKMVVRILHQEGTRRGTTASTRVFVFLEVLHPRGLSGLRRCLLLLLCYSY